MSINTEAEYREKFFTESQTVIMNKLNELTTSINEVSDRVTALETTSIPSITSQITEIKETTIPNLEKELNDLEESVIYHEDLKEGE